MPLRNRTDTFVLLIAAVAAFFSVEAAAQPPASNSPAVTAPDPIQILVDTRCGTPRKRGCWIKLTGSDFGSFDSVALARTCANFDGAATVGGTPCTGRGPSPWSSDSAVNQGGMSGIGLTRSYWEYTSGDIRESDGLTCVWGSGHTNGGDSSIYCFSIRDAAAAMNAGEKEGKWTLRVPSARFVSAAAGKPEWSNQGFGTEPGRPYYWATTNRDGVKMPIGCHSYKLTQFIPGDNKLSLNGLFCFSDNASMSMGSAYFYDDTLNSNDGMVGPVTIPFGTHNSGTAFGLVQLFNSFGVNLGFSSIDHNAYSIGFDKGAGHYVLYRISGYMSQSSIAISEVGSCERTGNFNQDALVIPDPVNGAGHEAYFQDLGVNAGFLIFLDITNSPAIGCQYSRYASYPSYKLPESSGYTWDSKRKVIAFCTGDKHIYNIIPNSDLDKWRGSEPNTDYSGDFPAFSPDGPANFVRLKYLPHEDLYAMLNHGDLYLMVP